MRNAMHLLSLVALLGSLANAAPTRPDLDAIAGLINNEIVAVARFDVANISPEQIAAWFDREMGLQNDVITDRVRQFETGCRIFLASGAKEYYVPIRVPDLMVQMYPLVAVPVPAGADAQAILKAIRTPFLQSGGTMHGLYGPDAFSCIHDRLVIAAANEKAYQHAISTRPVERPELAQAMDATADYAANLLVIPSSDHRRVLAEIPPKLSDEGVQAALMDLQWLSLGINPPPTSSIKLVIRSADAASAARTADMLTERLKVFTAMSPAGDSAQLAEALSPSVAGDRVIIESDQQTTEQVLKQLLVPSFRQAREMAKQEMAITNLKALGQTICMWQAEHDGVWPTSLDQLVQARMISDIMLVSTVSGKKTLVYIRPPKGIEKSANPPVMMYDDVKHLGKRETIALFADAHVERIPIDKLDGLIEEARKLSEAYYKNRQPDGNGG